MLGFGKRISYAFRCFFSIVSNGEVPEDIAPEVVKRPALEEQPKAQPQITPPPVAPPQPATQTPTDSTDRAIQMLALLQREGRLIDFFSENLAPYTDAQIGAAVREMHENCRKALEHYVQLEPVIAGEEDKPVTVDSNFDPAAIKLIGNVTGQPPLRGLLRHHGWRATKVNLPPLQSDETSRAVIAPAEVEVQ